MATANIAEIFSSIQGEGLRVGERHLFIRFCGCNLDCRYCDTRAARSVPTDCRIEKSSGSGAFVFRRNPLDVPQLMSVLADLLHRKELHDAVALTGGEPLLHAVFLRELLPQLRPLTRRVYLETNGTLPEELASIIEYVDTIAMDIKLPSCSGQPPQYETNRKFLNIAVAREVFVKLVICAATTEKELAEAARVVADVNSEVPLVLQPVTPVGDVAAPRPVQILRLHAVAKKILPNVRVIPQTHKITGQL